MQLKKKIINIITFMQEYFVRANAGKIAFVIKRTVPFSGNTRILAEALLASGNNEIVVFKDGPLDKECLSWVNQGVRVYQGVSLKALRDVHSAGTIVLGHSGRDAFLQRRRLGRKVINLWHGVALKRIEHLMPKEEKATLRTRKRRRLMSINSRVYDAMVASSATDRLTNALAFGVDLDKVHVTGLPRFDYLNPDYVLAKNLQLDVQRLNTSLAGRRMVLYAPTFRETAVSVLEKLTPEVLEKIKAFLQQHNLVLGIRPHPYDKKALTQVCDWQWVLDVSPSIYMEPAVVLRAASVLVVDYSSIWVDYLLLKRPIIGLMPDFENYATRERGFIFDLHEVLPGPIRSDWLAVLQDILYIQNDGFEISQKYSLKFSKVESVFLPPEQLRFKSVETCLDLFFGVRGNS